MINAHMQKHKSEYKLIIQYNLEMLNNLWKYIKNK